MNQRLFEAHIPVRDLEKSMTFYEQVLGLWEQPAAGIGRHHFAIEVAVEEMDPLIAGLHRHGIDTYNFLSDGSDRPMVFAWMAPS